MLRILDPSAKVDYFYFALLGAIPTALAYHFGAAQNVEFEGDLYLGYWVKTNFWPFIFVHPFSLWIVRTLFNRIAPVSSSEMAVVPPIIQLIREPAARQQAYMEMRHYMSSPFLLGSVFLVAMLIQIADMAELMGVYFLGNPIRAGETDWSVMFVTGVMSWGENLLLVAFAYTVQYFAIWFQCLLLFFLLGHNLFFLNRVYQRSRVKEGQEQNYIKIDLDDVNRCFGFRAANDAFNSQVILLIIFGVLALISRYNNVYVDGALLRLGDLFHWPPKLPQMDFFPDVGQWMLSTFWLLTFVIVSLPAWVKLLPRLSRHNKSSELSIADYMKEFIPPSEWHYDDEPSGKQIDHLAAKFAHNSFWPTGNNRASQLFFFSGWVFLVILIPLQTEDTLLLAFLMVALGFIAYAFRTLLIVVLNSLLGFVDERLSKPNPDALDLDGTPKTKLNGKVFISYRREDASAYAKLIQQSLLPFVEADHLFMDRVAIHDGDDFVDTITSAVLDCDILLVIIGPRWATCEDANGTPRIKLDNDFVRLEIETGLQHERVVIPVLVGESKMPLEHQVPESLLPLLRRHAREMSDSRWEYDIGELVNAMADKIR